MPFSSGVFLIPYFLFLFLLGIPLFFLEVNLGQFTSQGPVQCWKMAPIFKGTPASRLKSTAEQESHHSFILAGLGISMCIMSFFLTVYYAMLIGYAILYFILSFRSKLEWATCGSWASASKEATPTRVLLISSGMDSSRLYRRFHLVRHAVQLWKYLQRSEWPLLYVGQSRLNTDRLVEYPKASRISQTCPALGWLFQVEILLLLLHSHLIECRLLLVQ